jgi:hypothetical protein
MLINHDFMRGLGIYAGFGVGERFGIGVGARLAPLRLYFWEGCIFWFVLVCGRFGGMEWKRCFLKF